MELIAGCWELYLTFPGDNIQQNCSFMDPSLTFLQSYMNKECALQVTAGVQNKNSEVIYCSGHLTVVKGGLVALQSPTSTNSVETRGAFQMTSLLCCRTTMDGVIGQWMPELAQPDDDDTLSSFDLCTLTILFEIGEHLLSSLQLASNIHRVNLRYYKHS